MAETTFEEAKRCPKCGLPGDDTSKFAADSPTKGKVTVYNVFCRNELCLWYNTSWLVQVNPDGTIPTPGSQLGAKKYPKLSPESETRVREAMEAQIRAETQPGGGEIRNPRGN